MSTQRWRIVHEPWREPHAQYFAQKFNNGYGRFWPIECFATQEQAEAFIEGKLKAKVEYGTSTVVKEYEA